MKAANLARPAPVLIPRDREANRGNPPNPPHGMHASLADILIAWCAAFPERQRDVNQSFRSMGVEVCERFPFSWGQLMARVMAARALDEKRIGGAVIGYDEIGAKVREQLVADGVWELAHHQDH